MPLCTDVGSALRGSLPEISFVLDVDLDAFAALISDTCIFSTDIFLLDGTSL